MTNMWDAATLDYEQERLDSYVAAASVAVADQHGFVLQASTKDEFVDRLAIVGSVVEGAIERVTYSEPSAFPMVHQTVLASWERDFDLVAEQRQIETQRRNARRAYFRRSAKRDPELIDWKAETDRRERMQSGNATPEDELIDWGKRKSSLQSFGALSCPQCKSDVSAGAKIFDHGDHEVLRAKCESCGWSGSKKKPKTAGFKVVDDSSGYSNGTVYPNKQIADQANFGEGFTVQYTPDEPKTAAVKTAQIEWEDLGLQSVQTYPGLTEKVNLWAAEDMGVTGDVMAFQGKYLWYVHSIDNQEGDALAEGSESTLEAAKAMAERAMAEHSTQMSLFASRKTGSATLEEAIEVVIQNIPIQKAVVDPKYWGGYTIYDRGSSSSSDGSGRFVVREDKDTVAEGHETAMLPWSAPTGTPVAKVDINGKVTRLSSKMAADRSPNDIRSLVPGEDIGTWNVFRGYGDDDSASSQLGVKYEDLPEDAMAWLRARASKTAGENPFAKKDDEKKADAPKNDTTDSDKDGEQDGPTQPGEKPEPKGDDQQAAPADQQTPPQDDQAPQQDPAQPDAAQDKGQAQDPASTADTAQDQQQPADPTTMDVGQSTPMSFTMVDGGSTGSIEVTFVREENGVYFFNGPTGEFGVGQMNGQWQDADGNTFTFGGASPAPQGIGPAQDQAAAADAATPTPTPAGNAQQPAPAAPADPNAAPADSQAASPAQDAPPADDSSKKSDDSGDKKDDGDKKENPFAKKD